jgi:hypothetical protein
MRVAFYSLVSGAGSSTMAYQLSRLTRSDFYQESKNDLVMLIKDVLDPERNTVKYLSEYKKEDDEFNAVFDLDFPNKKIINSCDAIVVLTNNSSIDISKTIATLEQIKEVLKSKVKILVGFNRLMNGNVDREKKYTDISKSLILNAPSLKGLDIKFVYFRTNLLYYRGLIDGDFFMTPFRKRFKPISKEERKVHNSNNQISIHTSKDIEEYRDIPYTTHLEVLYHLQYGIFKNKSIDFINYQEFGFLINKIDDYTKELEKNNLKIQKLIYNGIYVKNNQVVLKDQFNFLEKLGFDFQNTSIAEKRKK